MYNFTTTSEACVAVLSMKAASKGSYWNGRKVLDAAKKAGGIAAAKGTSPAMRGDLYDTAYCNVINNALNAAA